MEWLEEEERGRRRGRLPVDQARRSVNGEVEDGSSISSPKTRITQAPNGAAPTWGSESLRGDGEADGIICLFHHQKEIATMRKGRVGSRSGRASGGSRFCFERGGGRDSKKRR